MTALSPSVSIRVVVVPNTDGQQRDDQRDQGEIHMEVVYLRYERLGSKSPAIFQGIALKEMYK